MIPLTKLKMVLIAPIPSANESTATEVSPGLFLSIREPYLVSCKRSRIILSPLLLFPFSPLCSFPRRFKLRVINRHILLDVNVFFGCPEMTVVQIRNDDREWQLHAIDFGVVLEVRLFRVESQCSRGQNSPSHE